MAHFVDDLRAPEAPISHAARAQFCDMVCKELQRAYLRHGAPAWTRHEFYGVLKEEVDELWDVIKSRSPSEAELVAEMVQVAAMCVRYFETTPALQRALAIKEGA